MNSEMNLQTRYKRLRGNPRKLTPNGDFDVILLGTGTPIPGNARACSSTLVLVGGQAFLVDTGRGFLNNFVNTGLTDVTAVFFTHYHSDHFSEFGEFMVTRTIYGAVQPLLVIGPPGANQTLGGLLTAYTLDNSYRKAHHGAKWSENGMKTDIREVDAGVVYDQSGIKVEMFAVDHFPVSPAVGYRFTYKNRVVVISGDTKKVSTMGEMARGADILVHEVTNIALMEQGQKYIDKRLGVMAREMLQYHTPTYHVAEIARDAKVKILVLTHFTPPLFVNWFFEALYIRGMSKIYKGRIIVGRDGMSIKL
jgi:ribonuclease Z